MICKAEFSFGMYSVRSNVFLRGYQYHLRFFVYKYSDLGIPFQSVSLIQPNRPQIKKESKLTKTKVIRISRVLEMLKCEGYPNP